MDINTVYREGDRMVRKNWTNKGEKNSTEEMYIGWKSRRK
jgi:hypothetical protein